MHKYGKHICSESRYFVADASSKPIGWSPLFVNFDMDVEALEMMIDQVQVKTRLTPHACMIKSLEGKVQPNVTTEEGLAKHDAIHGTNYAGNVEFDGYDIQIEGGRSLLNLQWIGDRAEFIPDDGITRFEINDEADAFTLDLNVDRKVGHSRSMRKPLIQVACTMQKSVDENPEDWVVSYDSRQARKTLAKDLWYFDIMDQFVDAHVQDLIRSDVHIAIAGPSELERDDGMFGGFNSRCQWQRSINDTPHVALATNEIIRKDIEFTHTVTYKGDVGYKVYNEKLDRVFVIPIPALTGDMVTCEFTLLDPNKLDAIVNNMINSLAPLDDRDLDTVYRTMNRGTLLKVGLPLPDWIGTRKSSEKRDKKRNAVNRNKVLLEIYYMYKMHSIVPNFDIRPSITNLVNKARDLMTFAELTMYVQSICDKIVEVASANLKPIRKFIITERDVEFIMKNGKVRKHDEGYWEMEIPSLPKDFARDMYASVRKIVFSHRSTASPGRHKKRKSKKVPRKPITPRLVTSKSSQVAIWPNGIVARRTCDCSWDGAYYDCGHWMQWAFPYVRSPVGVNVAPLYRGSLKHDVRFAINIPYRDYCRGIGKPSSSLSMTKLSPAVLLMNIKSALDTNKVKGTSVNGEGVKIILRMHCVQTTDNLKQNYVDKSVLWNRAKDGSYNYDDLFERKVIPPTALVREVKMKPDERDPRGTNFSIFEPASMSGKFAKHDVLLPWHVSEFTTNDYGLEHEQDTLSDSRVCNSYASSTIIGIINRKGVMLEHIDGYNEVFLRPKISSEVIRNVLSVVNAAHRENSVFAGTILIDVTTYSFGTIKFINPSWKSLNHALAQNDLPGLTVLRKRTDYGGTKLWTEQLPEKATKSGS